MDYIRRIQKFDVLKTLADARRLAILRLLMVKPATLSQLGHALGEHPAQVRHHLKQLESAGLIELVSTQVVRGFVEKYYQAKARAFTFQEIILPASAERDTILVLGSHDLALEMLAQNLRQLKEPTNLLTLPIGSLDGLVSLRQGNAQVAGCHLFDPDSGEYNLPFLRHFFPDRSVIAITLAQREQGLLLPPGNPQQMQSLEDLARPDVTFINRNRGSGTRLWLERNLRIAGIETRLIRGYNLETHTHTGVAEAILQKRANVGLGLRAIARQFGLDFVPLFQERYDLVMLSEQVDNRRMRPFFDLLQSGSFRRLIDSMGGYETSHTGEQCSV
jgi:putative molybdopterin biosynthesis protein